MVDYNIAYVGKENKKKTSKEEWLTIVGDRLATGTVR